MKTLFIIIALLSCISIKAQDLDSAKIFMEHGEYEKAISIYTKHADTGNIIAISYLGSMYQHGKGTSIDYQKAKYWYEKVIDKEATYDYERENRIYTMSYLAELYLIGGYGLEQDHKKAFELLTEVVKHSDLDIDLALTNLAYLYYYGYGVEIDYNKAFELYKKAARNGNQYGYAGLGDMYRNGYGIYQDGKKAIEYYKKAVDKGNVKSMLDIAQMYDKGESVEPDFSKALQWYNRAADSNSVEAFLQLGYIYGIGKGIDKNIDSAIYWYLKSTQNSTEGYMNIGALYHQKTPPDYQEAFKWYKKAANSGDTKAYVQLGYLYSKGMGVEKNMDSCIYWYKKAARNGDLEVQKALKENNITW